MDRLQMVSLHVVDSNSNQDISNMIRHALNSLREEFDPTMLVPYEEAQRPENEISYWDTQRTSVLPEERSRVHSRHQIHLVENHPSE